MVAAPISMHEHDESDEPSADASPALPFGELALTSPILAGKLARLSPEQLALIFPRMNSVGPL
ncbi:hypothetical protein [Arthrobacter sp. EpRS71]|uniref:hypothetical protein n=1 Tax=Arthrobacter sp. EpRS71 TaxID=1743141 RepID=UPI0007464529|nr:hypothetical protein [Arthrobacter sp. EpRS71]KUM42334.1 hypothetical protein AR689_01885 [Arthrobacter sp. EpRS71]